MSRKRRNRQRPGATVDSHTETGAAQAYSASETDAKVDTKPALPVWRWKTFPVYFAFALGGFIGAYAGYITGFVHSDSGNSVPSTVMFGVAALLLGFGVAKIGVRGLMGWGVIRPSARRK